MTFRDHSQGNIRRAGVITALAATMLVGLAACGGPTTPATTPPATVTQTAAMAPVETTVGAALETAITTAPSPVSTQSTDMGDMGDMGDMAGGTATPTQASSDVAETATAAPAANQDANAGSTTQVQGTLREWAIDLSQQEVPAGEVTFIVTNTGQNTHNFTVEDSTGAVVGKTPNFSSLDGAQTLELELSPGTYNIICSLPGHAARGQQTQLVVK
jgi:uncharacterized cupredoxin-like copper-binding protein